ncbi:Na+/H+ antiporter subunit E [Natrinema longum]|uniref:Na+/H+ antiporter subunit E n=1 Tax=Natrinema longum TaxID=370324 RepID=A0A8A2UC75_9EURY|nr:Na+/H+ antiporter subunit E [Natrinema longum]MBZ6495971.1 Na+/H+ antiporter subunit E [Natrinema longum]QSW86092.1 Na+/H+ antiporter subunit E [Natrinema longum]
MRVRTWPVIGIVFAVLWVFVRGFPLTPISLVRGLLAGLVVGLPVAFVFRRLYGKHVDLGRGVRVLPYAGRYLGAFTWELLRANLDVAYRVLSPGMPIEPEVILVPLRVESDIAITVIANSITITPGTVTLDYDDETNALYVHGVNGRDPEAIAEPIRTWEDYALELFDEDASPSDPAPEIVVSGGERDRRRDRQGGGVDDD